MEISVVGLGHKTAPVEVLEKLAIGKQQLKEALALLFDYVPQGIILSTCNRTEVYTLTDQHRSQRTKVESFLSALGEVPSDKLSPYLYTFRQEETVRHLFKVASGLESMILGEFEVLGQVRQSLEKAESTGLVCKPLLRLFQEAVRVGRRAREETAISKNAVSVSSIAIELAKMKLGDLTRCQTLVISAGEASKLTLKALAKSGGSRVAITSRSYEKALTLASALGGEAIPFHHLKEVMAQADLVISCSGAPHFVIEHSAVVEAMQTRPHRPLMLIDIAVPRDIDPRVREIANVLLYDIDDLTTISESNQRQRTEEEERVMAIVDAEVTKFMSWWHSQQAVPTIIALVNKAEEIRRVQLAKTLSKIQVSDEERAAIDTMTRAIVKKILHDPIHHLKNNGNNSNYIRAIKEIFDLDDQT